MKTVIFACVHNAGRSQMAAAWFNRLANPSKAQAISAGTQPSNQVHPVVIDVMREKAFDLTKAQPQKLTRELAAGASYLVTMGCGEECPYIPGVPILDWPLPDPKGQDIGAVREIRDDIERRVKAFVEEISRDADASTQGGQ